MRKKPWKIWGFKTNKEARNNYGWDYRKKTYANTKAGQLLRTSDLRFKK